MRTLKYLFRVLKYMNAGEKFIYLPKEEFNKLIEIEHFPTRFNPYMSLGLIAKIIKTDYPTIFNNYVTLDERLQAIAPLKKDGKIDMPIYNKITRTDFINLATEAYKKGLLTTDEFEKINPIKEKSMPTSFKESIKGKTFHYSNNRGTNVKIPVDAAFELLELPIDELIEVLKTKPFGLHEDEFADFLNAYTLKYDIFDRFFLSPNAIDNIEKLASRNDIFAFNYSLREEPFYAQFITVNTNLWDNILSKIPSDFNKLEKAYYIYYQLCKTFTYSEDYFAISEKTNYNDYIEELSWNTSPIGLVNLDEKNNQLICYEIMGIYQKFLKYLNIKYMVKTNLESGVHVLFAKHPTINAIIDNMVLSIDATRGVINGDMPLAKENKPLKGFICLNNNRATQEKFNKSLTKVNKYIQETETKEQSFYSILDEYNALKTKDNISGLSDSEKLNILVQSIKETTLSETDRLAHISNLTDTLFPEKNCTNHFVLQNIPSAKVPKISTIISYGPTKDTPPADRRYITYSTVSGQQEMTLSELLSAFKNNQYEYMLHHQKNLPGILGPIQHK